MTFGRTVEEEYKDDGETFPNILFHSRIFSKNQIVRKLCSTKFKINFISVKSKLYQ